MDEKTKRFDWWLWQAPFSIVLAMVSLNTMPSFAHMETGPQFDVENAAHLSGFFAGMGIALVGVAVSIVKNLASRTDNAQSGRWTFNLRTLLLITSVLAVPIWLNCRVRQEVHEELLSSNSQKVLVIKNSALGWPVTCARLETYNRWELDAPGIMLNCSVAILLVASLVPLQRWLSPWVRKPDDSPVTQADRP